MNRMCSFYLILCIIVALTGCQSDTKSPESTATMSPIVETFKFFSPSPVPTLSWESTPSPLVGESTSKIDLTDNQVSELPSNSEDNNVTSIGFLKLGLSSAEVVNELGDPIEKSKAVEWGADGLVHQSWYYKTYGINLDMIDYDGKTKVNSIAITAPCDYKINRGIGIGSKRKDVVEKYKDEINEGDSRNTWDNSIVVGSIYDGIIFSFENDMVSRIFVGAGAE